MTLSQHLAKVVLEALIRAAVKLLRAEELPPLPAGAQLAVVFQPLSSQEEPTAEPPLSLHQPDWVQLERLARVDGVLAQALRWQPERRWRQ